MTFFGRLVALVGGALAGPSSDAYTTMKRQRDVNESAASGSRDVPHSRAGFSRQPPRGFITDDPTFADFRDSGMQGIFHQST